MCVHLRMILILRSRASGASKDGGPDSGLMVRDAQGALPTLRVLQHQVAQLSYETVSDYGRLAVREMVIGTPEAG